MVPGQSGRLRPRPRRVIGGLIAGAIAAIGLAGCFAVEAAGTGGDSAAAMDGGPLGHELPRWPKRWGDEALGTKGALIELDGPVPAWVGRRYGPNHHGRPAPRDLEQVARLAAGRTTEAGYRFRLEGPGGLVFGPIDEVIQTAERETRELAIDDDRPLRVFVSGRPVDVVGSGEHLEIERTWMTEHRADGAPRGVVALVPGLYGAPRALFDAFADRLADDGWLVLRILAPSSRFMETHELQLGGDDLDGSVTTAASWFDERFAEVAYAVEAGLDEIERRDPSLRSKPRVLVGMSGGAISAPAVAARMIETGRPLQAAVLVAGGVDALGIAGTSSYTGWIDAVRFRWSDWEDGDVLPPSELLDEARGGYAEAASLDPGSLLWAFDGVETLVLQATRDEAVPVASGQALWEGLGKPERWTTWSGHLELFLRLWLSADGLVRWIDRASPRGSVAEASR